MKHTCHAHGCTATVPPSMFMCRIHWFKLKKTTRDAIWREYRPGQENDKSPSIRYMAVQQRAIAEAAFVPRDEAAARIAAQYLLKAMEWRERAIAEGQGDPFS